MITITGLIEFDPDDVTGPLMQIRHKRNLYWDECVEEAKAVYEFNFEYDSDTENYEFVSLKKISKTKANKNAI